MSGIEWYLIAFLSGAIIGLFVGVTRTVSDIKKHPEKWEEHGVTKALE